MHTVSLFFGIVIGLLVLESCRNSQW